MTPLAGLVARARSLWTALRWGVDAEMSEEFRLHMELRAEDLVRGGLTAAEARRQARIEFGSPERYKDEGRRVRGLRPFDDLRASALDFKLGLRMLRRYPGLTVVGGLATTFAIAIGAGAFEFATQALRPTLPIERADRIVAVRRWDPVRLRVEPRTARELALWRTELRTVRELGAARAVERNLVVDGRVRGAPIVVAELSASAYRVAHATPLLGRLLVDGDEAPGAPPVVVLGEALWRARFASDSAIVGRSIRLGDAEATVVGVSSASFGFPLYQDVAVPLRLAVDGALSAGVELPMVFGRLADGATLDGARAEVATVTGRATALLPASHARLRTRVDRFADAISQPLMTSEGYAVYALPAFLVALLVLVFGNVALLVFARAATRESEIVARSALGASRARIVMQLFIEALVLGAIGLVGGLAIAASAVKLAYGFARADGAHLPFWFHDTLAPRTVAWAVGLTVFGAVLSGALPGLRITRDLQARLRQAAAGAGGLRLGGVWTAVIVAQVAVTVTFPVATLFALRDSAQIRAFDPGLPSREYLVARLESDRDTTAARLVGEALERAIGAEPGVVGVAHASLLPGMDHPQRRIEVEGVRPPRLAPTVSSVSAGTRWFDVAGASVLAGRAFVPGDERTRTIVVNARFVRHVLGGGAALGARVRYLDPADPDDATPGGWRPSAWYEIVGVVADLGASDGSDPHETGAAIYHAIAAGAPTHLAVRVAGDPRAFEPRLRELAIAADARLRVYDVTTLDRIPAGQIEANDFFVHVLAGVSALALLLALAGIYAVMALTVSRRTREIGVRVALGADRRRVVAAVFARPFAQVGAGVLAGAAVVGWLVSAVIGALTVGEVAAVAGYALLMFAVCGLACVVPTRRALAIQPTEALRADG